jgi:competence protein ComEC
LVALLMLVPAFLWLPARPGSGEFRAVVLDVGQGLAVHVQTAGHDLVFDTGPPYGPRADAGGRVLLPYLGAIGVTRLDKLVISHGDSDHIGGAATLMEGVAVVRLVKTPVEAHPDLAAHAVEVGYCAAGTGWEWDGVRFEWLHPGADPPYRRINDHACVLRISGEGGALLLTSDIEAVAERSLLGRNRSLLAADVVTAPHHGSRTSSTQAFVAAVGATHVIHPVGNMNQYRHPHPAVWARWDAAGARNWRTDGQGAITVDMGLDGPEVSAQRERVRRYWHGR